jgi:hypothetical protein
MRPAWPRSTFDLAAGAHAGDLGREGIEARPRDIRVSLGLRFIRASARIVTFSTALRTASKTATVPGSSRCDLHCGNPTTGCVIFAAVLKTWRTGRVAHFSCAFADRN